MILVALDASVLINFLVISKVSLLASLPGLGFVVPEEVVAEIRRPAQARALAAAIDRGDLQRLESMAPGEADDFLRLNEDFGRGESACLAVAQARGWFIACDERGAFLNRARRVLGEGRMLDTPTLLLLAIDADLLTIAEADELKQELERARFKMPFGSFRDLPGVGSNG
ncbi:MAG: hypothetical protein OXH70_06535 [Acidobacteria bacterium]|nr:hypothetical protein [Acidobacteriota bacterium]